MEDSSIQMKNLTKPELLDIEKGCKDGLTNILCEFDDKMVSVNDEILEYSKKLENKIEIWLEDNLQHINNNLKCILPLKTDKLTISVIQTMISRQKDLQKRFLKLQKCIGIKKKNNSPFNIKHILNIRDNLLPFVFEVLILRNEIMLISKKMYKV